MENKVKIEKLHFDIVNMTAAHIPRAAAIEADAFSMPWSEQAFADALALDYAWFYTALVDGKVAGYCGVYFAADEGEITNIAVAPEYRRHNIAEALLRRVLSKAGQAAVRRVFLEVRSSNTPAVRLYEKAGFAAAGIRRGFYQHPAEDALVMMYETADI